MAVHHVWLGSIGPFIYNDELPLNDPDNLTDSTEQGLVTTGQVSVLSPPTADPHLVRAEDLRAALPSGIITMWSGSIASIPTGWLLCNGTNGTPNLSDRFILASGTNAPGTTGGSNTITINNNTLSQVVQSGTGTTVAAHPHTHTTTPTDTRPSYYVLAYIMKA